MKTNINKRLLFCFIFAFLGLILLIYGTFPRSVKVLKPEVDLNFFQNDWYENVENVENLSEFRINRELTRDGIHRIYVPDVKRYVHQLDGNPAEFCPT